MSCEHCVNGISGTTLRGRLDSNVGNRLRERAVSLWRYGPLNYELDLASEKRRQLDLVPTKPYSSQQCNRHKKCNRKIVHTRLLIYDLYTSLLITEKN